MVSSDRVKEDNNFEGLSLAHKLVQRVTDAIEKLSLNTIPSSFMEFINDFVKLAVYPKSAVEMAVRALAPIAPHISEELWVLLGNSPGVQKSGWPSVLPEYLEGQTVTIVVQVNGKLRARLDIMKDASKEEVLALARESASKYLEGCEVKKAIFVPARLVNFVV
ncbi:leucyl-tRNA synthetase [Chlamydia trachomatis]|nr:leucyl-tRNA synthetase [Chlamydia trachomatis]